MFEIKHVSKKYGDDVVLRDISMTIGKGMNFIIGSSGSGKTTLLKMLSGMEQEFEGEVFYEQQDMKKLSEQEKSYFYNHVFGFVWQDFNLLDEMTVLENVMLVQYLKPSQDKKAAMKILRDLKIADIADQKAGKLSGGQKQRVAIARELLKNPKVILADEPTSALDEKSAALTMNLLRDISKSRMVLVVTHDTSLIDSKSKVYELDKGELVAAAQAVETKAVKSGATQAHRLSFQSALRLAVKNAKSKWGRFAATSVSVLIAATLLLVTVSGAIANSGSSAFDDLFKTYGNSILDMSLVNSFMSASGTNGKESDQPNANVTQQIGGLYDRYKDDPRVAHIAFIQAFNEIKVTVDGKEHLVKTTGTVPTINDLTAGEMPMGSGKEVVVPNSFVKELGLTDQEAIGKVISFAAAVYNWDSGEPVLTPVQTTATIVGVVDTSVKQESQGQMIEYTVDDSFFFSMSAIEEMCKQAKLQKESVGFTIRTKTPADLIAVKDELNADGIVPLGRFELVEDMVRLSSQTKQQSGSAIVVIGVLAVAVALAVSLMTACSRKRAYAIYKVSGYSARHLAGIAMAEALLCFGVSAVLFLCVSPLSNLATMAFWNVNILNGRLLCTGVGLVGGISVLSGAVTMAVSTATKASASLKTGDR